MFKNPILESKRNLFLYIIFWLIIALLNIVLLIHGLKLSVNTALIDGIVFNLLLAGLGICFWFTAAYFSIENKNLSVIISGHLFAGFFASILWLAVGFHIITGLFNYTDNFNRFFWSTYAWRFLIGTLFYYLMISFYYIVIYNKNLQEKILNEIELKNLVAEAELKSLKFQINPHFIFNSLNSMSALTTINPDRAREMILKLAEFLRFTLANNDKKTNSLREELKNCKLYLEIEKIRFEDKFEYIEEIKDGCDDIQIPSMILQPLFENAIKHGVYESLDKVTIKLSCGRINEYIQIVLENNFEAGSQIRKGAGIGLKNIQYRLQLIYGQPDMLDIQKEKNSFRVKLFIPA